MGWVPPQRVAEVARAHGLLDPNLETDRAKMALFIFERLRVRAAPSASLNFEKDDLHAQHLLEDLAPEGHPVCTHLSRRPAEGVLRALQVILLAFTPLTKKLASTLHYITTDPTPSDIIALRSFEKGLSDLLVVCNQVSVISNAFATAQSRNNSDPPHEIEPSLTNSLMDYFRGEFGENLSVEFYARLSTASWIVSSPSEAPTATQPQPSRTFSVGAVIFRSFTTLVPLWQSGAVQQARWVATRHFSHGYEPVCGKNGRRPGKRPTVRGVCIVSTKCDHCGSGRCRELEPRTRRPRRHQEHRTHHQCTRTCPSGQLHVCRSTTQDTSFKQSLLRPR